MTNVQKEWEKEFDEFFSDGYIRRISAETLKYQCKVVIKDILVSHNNSLVERLEGVRKTEEDWAGNYEGDPTYERGQGYNQALTEAQEIIRNQEHLKKITYTENV